MKPTLGPYLAKNPLLYLYLTLLDSLYKLLRLFTKNQKSLETQKNILIVHLAHRGDVILATCVLPLLKKHYPDATLNMLIGSWNQEILEDHPLLDKLHFLDHPKVNRSSISFLKKWIRYLRQIKLLIPQLKDYDLSIDLYPYYPNSHQITYLAKIPRRIGYQSGGGSPLLTDVTPWINKNQSIALDFLELLKPLGIFEDVTTLKSNLSPPCKRTFENLKETYKLDKPYLIFHLYSGNHLKDWEDNAWRELAEKCSDYSIIFTGGSSLEKANIDLLRQGLPNTLNLAGNLSFSELKALVSNATALVAVDTMIGHLAAVYDIPSLILYSKVTNPIYWKPLSSTSFILDE